jgi:hypothetical protein
MRQVQRVKVVVVFLHILGSGMELVQREAESRVGRYREAVSAGL